MRPPWWPEGLQRGAEGRLFPCGPEGPLGAPAARPSVAGVGATRVPQGGAWQDNASSAGRGLLAGLVGALAFAVQDGASLMTYCTQIRAVLRLLHVPLGCLEDTSCLPRGASKAAVATRRFRARA